MTPTPTTKKEKKKIMKQSLAYLTNQQPMSEIDVGVAFCIAKKMNGLSLGGEHGMVVVVGCWSWVGGFSGAAGFSLF